MLVSTEFASFTFDLLRSKLSLSLSLSQQQTYFFTCRFKLAYILRHCCFIFLEGLDHVSSLVTTKNLSHARVNWICFFHSSKLSFSLSLSQRQTRLWLCSNWVIKKHSDTLLAYFSWSLITRITTLMRFLQNHLVVQQEFFPTARSLIVFFQVTANNKPFLARHCWPIFGKNINCTISH